jgi:hypothetical protein
MSLLQQINPGRSQFVDANGAPLAGGTVTTYLPGTTTPVTTYQDPNSTTLNTNPVQLDNLGSATIWYTGLVRMIVKDSNGNQIYDQIGGNPIQPDDTVVVVNVLDYGAQGIGAGHNDTASIQSAIDAVYALGGGEVYFPWTPSMATTGYYNITSPLILRPGVSLVGNQRRPKIKNLRNSGGAGFQECLLPGNFHPDFTEDLVYYSCGTLTPGYTVTLANPGDAGHFAVGDQVSVASTATTAAGSFTIPLYMWLNEITAIAGANISLKWPVDEPVSGGIALLSAAAGRTVPLFFATGNVFDLDFESNTNWVSDSAWLGGTIERVTASSGVGAYGNAFQHCVIQNCKFFCAYTLGELSHNSLHTRVSSCEFLYHPRPGLTANQGISQQECARFVTWEDCDIDMSEWPGTAATGAITTINCQHVRFRGLNIKMTGTGFNGHLVAMNGSSDPSFAAIDNLVEDVEVQVESIARFVNITMAGSWNVGNGVRRSRFFGQTTSDTVRFQESTGNIFEGNTIQGKMLFGGTNTGNRICDNYITDGFFAEGTNDQTPYQNNYIKRNSSDKWIAKCALINTIPNGQLNVPHGSTLDVYSVDIGGNIESQDEITFDMIIEGEGTADRTVRIHIYNVTTGIDYTVASFTIPAADASPNQNFIRGSIYWQQLISSSFVQGNGQSGAATMVASKLTSGFTPGDELSFRVEGSCLLGTDTSLNWYKLNVGIQNPWFG